MHKIPQKPKHRNIIITNNTQTNNRAQTHTHAHACTMFHIAEYASCRHLSSKNNVMESMRSSQCLFSKMFETDILVPQIDI